MNENTTTIRVFVSSTFKDMYCERDYLANVVFPSLRDRCLRAGLNFIDIDLRWGVPEKTIREKNTLEICFDEIDKCHPFFIGLIGERFGEVPTEEDLPMKAHSILGQQIQEGNSYTSLEIYYAFLKQKGFCHRSFFYFRDPSIISFIPKIKKKEFEEVSKQKQLKLQSLKGYIKKELKKYNLIDHLYEYYPTYKGLELAKEMVLNSFSELEEESQLKNILDKNPDLSDSVVSGLTSFQLKFLEDYGRVILNNLQDFGDQVEKHIWTAIENETPATRVKKSPEFIERSFHEHFMLGLTQYFYGREKELSELKAYIFQDVNQPIVLAGSSGSGKSALMAKLYNNLKSENIVSTFLLPHFVGASPDSTDIFKTISRFVIEISKEFCLGIDNLPVEFNELRDRFVEILFSTGRKPGKKIIILIDAVNQFTKAYDPCNFTWLPKILPKHVKIIISAIDDSNIAKGKSTLMLNIEKLGIKKYQVSDLSLSDRRNILHNLFKVYGKNLSEDLITTLAQNDESYKPLYLKIVSEELRLFSKRRFIPEKVYSFPQDIKGLFNTVISRLENDNDFAFVRNALSFIECSRTGLQEAELIELGDLSGKKIPKLIWLKIFWGLRPYLCTLGDDREGNIVFFHSQLRNSVREQYLRKPVDEAAIYNTLINFSLNIFDKLKTETFRGKHDSLNCFWDLAIYIVKSGMNQNLEKLKEVLKTIFSLSPKEQNYFYKIPDNLIYYIRIESDSVNERDLFMKTFDDLCANSANEDLAGYILLKGDLIKKTGDLDLALCFYRWSQNIYNNILHINKINRLILRSLAVAYNKSGEVFSLLNNSSEAISFYKKDITICEEAFIQSGKAVNEGRDLLTGLNALADYYIKLSDTVNAKGVFNKALSISKSIYEGENEDHEKGFDYSMCLIKMADLYLLTGKVTEAVSEFQKAIEIRNAIHEKDPSNPDNIKNLAVCYEKLSDAYLLSGNTLTALDLQLISKEKFQKCYEQDWRNESKSNIFSLVNERLGQLYLTRGESALALSSFLQAVEIRKTIFHEEIENTDIALNYSKSLITLGDYYSNIGNYYQSSEYYLQALSIRVELSIKYPSNSKVTRMVSESHIRVGIQCEKERNFQGALKNYTLAQEILDALVSKDIENIELQRESSILFQHFGDLASGMKAFESAMSHYKKSLQMTEKLFKSSNNDDFEYTRDLVVIHIKLGDCFAQMQKDVEAEDSYLKAFKLLKQNSHKGMENVDKLKDLSICANKLGDLSMKQNHKEALAYYTYSLEIMTNLFNNDRDNLGNYRVLSICNEKIGIFYFATEQFETSLKYYQKSMALRKDIFDKFNQSFSDGMNLAAIYYRTGKNMAIINKRIEGGMLVNDGLNILKQFQKDGKMENQPEYKGWVERFRSLLEKIG